VTAQLDPPVAIAPVADRVRAWMTAAQPEVRSLTGDGVRRTLDLLASALPDGVNLHRTGVPSGTAVFDWTVPDEWNVREAWVRGPDGRAVADLADHALHLVGYSTPVRARMGLEELHPHLHSLPDHPEWIPYRTSYYHRDWGFCLRHRDLEALVPGEYDVLVDATLEPGELVYGEVVLPGRSDDEVLVSSHLCHPAMANDNLTGLAVALETVRRLDQRVDRRYTYRFLFAPGTIGSLTWLSQNLDRLDRVRHGLVITGLGGGGRLVYKQTLHGDRTIDHAAAHVVQARGGEVRPYSPWGYDERQFNAVGFGLPVGRLTRTPHGEYPEYHTSADDLDFVGDAELEEALDAITEILDVVEGDETCVNLSPYGEPQLGKHGLYPTTGGHSASQHVMAMLWTLALSDGATSLLGVATRSGVPFRAVRGAADALVEGGLLAPVDPTTSADRASTGRHRLTNG
jgi:aminopeptidase-like protein